MRKGWILAIAALFATAPAVVHGQGFDPAQMINMDKVIRDASKAGRADRERSSPAEPIDVTTDLGKAVASAFSDATQARAAILSRDEPGFFQRNDLIYNIRGRLKDAAPTILMLPIDTPYAVTYPDRVIVLSRRLVDGLDGETIESNYWTLRAVAAHELAHHYDGHALFNWLATRGRESARRNQAVAAATRVTRFLPFSFEYKYEVAQAYPNLRQHPPVYEFLADYWAYYVLKEMKAPPGVMTKMLQAIVSAGAESSGAPDALGLDRLIRRRAQCMVLLEGDFPTDNRPRAMIEAIPLFDALSFHLLATPEKYRHQVRASIEANTRLSRAEREEELASLDARLQAAAARPESEKEDTSPPSFGGDAAYWWCAMAALAERDPSQQADMQALFSASDGRALANALVARQELDPAAPNRPILTFANRLDGLPLLEPGISFRQPAPETRPDLVIERSTRDRVYSGPRGPGHAVRIYLYNRGVSAPTEPMRVTAKLGAAPARIAIERSSGIAGRTVTGCTPMDLADATKPCAFVELTGPLRQHSGHEFELIVEGPALPTPEARILSLTADGCEKTSPADRCQIDEGREENNTFSFKIGALPDLARISSSEYETGMSLTISNRGYGPTAAGFLVDFPHGETGWTFSTCTAEEFAAAPGRCTGVRVNETIPPNGLAPITGRFFRLPGTPEDAPRGYLTIDYCPARDDPRAAADARMCAVEELDEENN